MCIRDRETKENIQYSTAVGMLVLGASLAVAGFVCSEPMGPVSYTHLQASRTRPNMMYGPKRAIPEQKATRVMICLLYTSRCV